MSKTPVPFPYSWLFTELFPVCPCLFRIEETRVETVLQLWPPQCRVNEDDHLCLTACGDGPLLILEKVILKKINPFSWTAALSSTMMLTGQLSHNEITQNKVFPFQHMNIIKFSAWYFLGNIDIRVLFLYICTICHCCFLFYLIVLFLFFFTGYVHHSTEWGNPNRIISEPSQVYNFYTKQTV